jgi:hypothetical protein
MKATTSIKRAVTIASLSAAGFFAPAPAHALQLTYDLRVLSSSVSGAVPAANAHSFTATQPDEVLTIGIYAIINGVNAAGHADDGFTNGQGSLISTGDLHGNLRGDTASATQVNNVTNFNSLTAQSGYAADLDGDGDLDIGTNLQTSPTTPPWFVASSVNGSGTAPILGTGNGSGPTEFLIGQTTFTLTGTPVIGQAFNLQFVPRVRTDGGVVGNKVHKFTLDGTAFSLVGTSSEIQTIATSVAYIVPEPSAIGMLLLGTVGLVGFRRSAFRRLLA